MSARLEAAAMEPRPFIALLPVAARTAPVLDRVPAAAGKTLQLGCLAFAVLLAALSSGAFAQQPAVTMAAASELPDAPGAGARGDGLASEASTDPASAGISGTVLDNGGDVIPGARVKLISQTRPSERSVLSGSNGEFAFSQLPPDTYQVTVTAANMGSYASPEIALHAGDQQLVSKIALPLSLAATSIRVYADRNEIAQEQVRLALDQRVMGILPNFYSSYDWNAPAMGAKQKFQLAFRSVTDPVAFMGAGALAGAQQSRNSFPGYGQGMQGYAKRYGAAYASDFTGRMLSSAVLPSLLHQDPRYFYKGTGSIASRALYAIGAAVYCKGDNGHWQPNYSEVLGNFAAGGISNLYYPSASRGASLVVLNGLIETAGRAGNNLLREFALKGLTSKASGTNNGPQ